MKIATWNVNSLKVRLGHLLEWLRQHQPDAVCLQEIKLEDEKFPAAELEAAGYRSVWYGQKTYNGVAILARGEIRDVSRGIPGFADEQRRVLAGTVRGADADVRLVCAYVPNGQSIGSDKFQYKLGWIEAFHSWLGEELKRSPRLAVLGDYNIAPAEEDVHDPKMWENVIHFTPPEREAFRRLTELGLKDSFRLFTQPEKTFTWWDYRLNAFRRKMGLRIDHILLSPDLATRCKSCTVDVEPRKLERPSDHAPVVAEIEV
jgi:exodeoxyribonuclease-3